MKPISCHGEREAAFVEICCLKKISNLGLVLPLLIWVQFKATVRGWVVGVQGQTLHLRPEDHLGPKLPAVRLSFVRWVPAGLGRVLRNKEETRCEDLVAVKRCSPSLLPPILAAFLEPLPAVSAPCPPVPYSEGLTQRPPREQPRDRGLGSSGQCWQGACRAERWLGTVKEDTAPRAGPSPTAVSSRAGVPRVG